MYTLSFGRQLTKKSIFIEHPQNECQSHCALVPDAGQRRSPTKSKRKQKSIETSRYMIGILSRHEWCIARESTSFVWITNNLQNLWTFNISSKGYSFTWRTSRFWTLLRAVSDLWYAVYGYTYHTWTWWNSLRFCTFLKLFFLIR